MDKTGMNFEGKIVLHMLPTMTPGHKCAKGKAQYIEVFYDNDEYEGGMDE